MFNPFAGPWSFYILGFIIICYIGNFIYDQLVYEYRKGHPDYSLQNVEIPNDFELSEDLFITEDEVFQRVKYVTPTSTKYLEGSFDPYYADTFEKKPKQVIHAKWDEEIELPNGQIIKIGGMKVWDSVDPNLAQPARKPFDLDEVFFHPNGEQMTMDEALRFSANLGYQGTSTNLIVNNPMGTCSAEIYIFSTETDYDFDPLNIRSIETGRSINGSGPMFIFSHWHRNRASLVDLMEFTQSETAFEGVYSLYVNWIGLKKDKLFAHIAIKKPSSSEAIYLLIELPEISQITKQTQPESKFEDLVLPSVTINNYIELQMFVSNLLHVDASIFDTTLKNPLGAFPKNLGGMTVQEFFEWEKDLYLPHDMIVTHDNNSTRIERVEVGHSDWQYDSALNPFIEPFKHQLWVWVIFCGISRLITIPMTLFYLQKFRMKGYHDFDFWEYEYVLMNIFFRFGKIPNHHDLGTLPNYDADKPHDIIRFVKEHRT